jgi:hypothetical protein
MAETTQAVETTPDTGSVTDPDVADRELADWAQDDGPKNRPSTDRPRTEKGTFKSSKAPAGEKKQIADAVKDTIAQGERELPRDEEEVEEEEVEEKPRSRKVRGIVNGQEEEIDLDDEEFAKVNAVQASRAAQKAWREAAEMRKEAQQLKQALADARAQVAQDPMKLFKALGISEEQVYQFAQNKTIEKIAETIDPNTGQPYSPEQQRILQLQKELEQKNLTEQQAKQKQEEIEFEQIKEVVRQDIDRKFTAALEQTGLPPTQYTMMRLADLMQSMGPDVDPATVAPLVLEDIVNEVRHTIYSMPVEVAIEVLGEDWVNDLRKYDIQKARSTKDKFGRNPSTHPANREQRVASRTRTKFEGTPQEAEEFLEKWAEGK